MNNLDNSVNRFNYYYVRASQRANRFLIYDAQGVNKLSFWGKMKLQQALKDFEKCLTITPDHWQSLFFKGKIFQRLEEYSKALVCFEKALEIEHRNFNIPQEASIVANQLGMTGKALEYSLEAIKRKPNDSGLLGNHALYLLMTGHKMEALETINKALLLNPSDEVNRKIFAEISAAEL